MKEHTVLETCPECGELVKLCYWDKSLHGMRTTCPKCQTSMLLCSLCEKPCNWDHELDTCKEDDPGRQKMTPEILKKRLFLPISDVWVKEEPAEGLLIAGKSQGTDIVLTLTGGGNLLLFDYLWFCYTGETNKPDLQQAIDGLSVPIKRIRFSDFHTVVSYLWDQGYSQLPIEWCQDGRVLVKSCLPVTPRSLRAVLETALEGGLGVPFKKDILKWMLPVFDLVTKKVSPKGELLLKNTMRVLNLLKTETPPDKKLKELALTMLSEENACTLPDNQESWNLVKKIMDRLERVEVRQNAIRVIVRRGQQERIGQMLRKIQIGG